MSIFKTARLAAYVVAGAAVGFASTANAEDSLDLAGKTIEFVIPFSESGGSAKWANFYA
ncbi:MAG: hypothetical protein JKX93_10120, partial [Rhizobiaceae bacterium]|nr:hypothetical protein [Rhizobiaceae bacterium]